MNLISMQLLFDDQMYVHIIMLIGTYITKFK